MRFKLFVIPLLDSGIHREIDLLVGAVPCACPSEEKGRYMSKVKFTNATEQLETCLSIFNPLEVSIDVGDNKVEKMSKTSNATKSIADSVVEETLYKTKTITASMALPTYAESADKLRVVFDVYLVDSQNLPSGYTIKKSPTGDIRVNEKKKFSFSYRLSIQEIPLQNQGGKGKTLLKVVDESSLLNGCRALVSHLKNEINKNNGDDNVEDYNITLNLDTVKLYAVGYVVVDGTTIRPDASMKTYGLEDFSQQEKSDYDDLMLESIKSNIDTKLKDKVYFAKKFLELKDLKVADILKGHSVQAKSMLKSDDRFFVKVG